MTMSDVCFHSLVLHSCELWQTAYDLQSTLQVTILQGAVEMLLNGTCLPMFKGHTCRVGLFLKHGSSFGQLSLLTVVTGGK